MNSRDWIYKLFIPVDRKKVTCIHKANIMKESDGLFKRCCEEVRSTLKCFQVRNVMN